MKLIKDDRNTEFEEIECEVIEAEEASTIMKSLVLKSSSQWKS